MSHDLIRHRGIDSNTQFLKQFSPETFFKRLPVLPFTARKFPVSRQDGRLVFAGRSDSGLLMNQAGCDLDDFPAHIQPVRLALASNG